MRSRPLQQTLLRERLDELVATFDISTIEPDPVQLVHRYTTPYDQEAAALIAAAFAYGRADIVVRNAGAVLELMEPGPHDYLMTFERAEALTRFRGFAHRFHKAEDLVAFLECLSRVVRQHGSIGALFRACYDERDDDIGPSLVRFVGRVVPASGRPAGRREGGTTRALHYLLSSPADGSACKRMNLFLRWMVRRTSPDLGLWTFVDPAKLVIPLDTHVHRITAFLGINGRKTADWKCARAVTDRLAKFDPADPVRYDFAICRLGILDLCSRKRRKENCDVCLLRDACRFPVRESKELKV
ncbi:MAG TPA: TIGR02757 family protein [Thermoanaerobaculia bacterium]|nr:TIGR02757 family protein [Thermoanaerobaculia bacterium]